MCNEETVDHFVGYENQPLRSLASNSLLIAAVIFAALTLISVIGGTIWWTKSSKKRRSRPSAAGTGRNEPVSIPLMDREYQSLRQLDNLIATAAGDSTLREVFDHSVTSGSGSGLPVLVPRTLSNEIELIENIGKGRFSDVWRGKWQNDDVCVKIFLSREESLFNREREIYHIVMLRHQNILGYIGSDVTSVNSCTQLRLVLNYHPLGSLFDFLSDPNFCSPLSDIVLILRSAIAGITHLHTEIFGTQGKPAIAHRDIKSKNILLKNPTTACIGDFGLAVTHLRSSNSVIIGNQHRIGTPRYAAPEVLDKSIKQDFEAYKMSDIYSFSLVMWESCQRVAILGEAEEYKTPYHDLVTLDPSIEEMKKIVSLEGLRPTFEAWSDVPHSLVDVMTQSWSQKPESRLTALNIKKKLEQLANVSGTLY